MKKQLRRVLVLLLAFTMCFGSAVTLFAADAGTAECPAVHTKDNCEYEAEEVVAPLCGKNGYTIYACKACHTHFIDDVTPALGGCSEFKVVAEVPVTCEKAGVKAHKECVVCGAKYIGDTLYTDAELAIKAGHTWGEWKETYVDCGKATAKVRTCTVCGKEEKEDGTKTDHKWNVVVTVEPNKNTNEPGKATATCEYCKATKEITVFAEGHKCTDCTKSFTKHEVVKATCEAEGVKVEYYECPCGKTYADKEGKTPITEEEYKEEMHPSRETRKIEATCETYGYEFTICKDCGETLEDKKIEPLGHDWLTYPYDIYYNYETNATSKTAEEGFTLIHKKGEVIKNYIKNNYYLKYGEKALYDTGYVTEQRFCKSYDKCKGSDWSTMFSDIEVTDENGVVIRVNMPETVLVGVNTEVIEKEAGHNYQEVTIPADCGHGSMTFYTCTNENCYDNYYMGYTGDFMLDKEGHLISERYLWDATTQTSVLRKCYYDGEKYVIVADEDVSTYSRRLNGESVVMIVDKDHPVTFGKEKDANNHAIENKDEDKSRPATCTVNGYLSLIHI